MQLIVLKCALGLDIAGLLVHGDNAVGDGPLGGSGAVLRRNPFVEILAVEEDDGVGGSGGWRGSGRDDFGLGLPDLGVLGLGSGLLGEGSGCESYEQEQGSG